MTITVYEKHHPQQIVRKFQYNDMSIKWCIEKRDEKIEHLSNSTKYRIQGIKWN